VKVNHELCRNWHKREIPRVVFSKVPIRCAAAFYLSSLSRT